MICKHVLQTARGLSTLRLALQQLHFVVDNITGNEQWPHCFMKYMQLHLAREQCARDELLSLVIQVVAECGSSCLGSSVGSLH